MKKTSYYIIFIVTIGVIFVSVWTYQRYFKEEPPSFLLFEVQRGDLQEVVRGRGEVASQKELDLGFPFAGTIEKTFVNEGQIVDQGKPLLKLETTDFELEVKKLEALQAQNRANLDKLIAGATTEDIDIAEIKVRNAEIAVKDAKQSLVDKLQDSYTKADDAIRNKVDQLFGNPRSSNPQINFTINDFQLETYLENERAVLETLLTSWQLSLAKLSFSSDLSAHLAVASDNLSATKVFLDKAALAVNSLVASAAFSQTTIDGYKSDVSTARTNINTAMTNLSAAEEKLSTAESSLALAKSELSLKQAGTRVEDIEIAKAKIQETENQILTTREKIKKSTIYAPIVAQVAKIWLEPKELSQANQVAVSLFSSGYKIRADISELDIGKIEETNGNEVIIRLDAFPAQKLKGKVISIEPKEVIKEGDKFYRVNIYFEDRDKQIRSGMSADLTINTSLETDVLKIPELAIYQKGDKKFVRVLIEKQTKISSLESLREVEIETGISDGEWVEIIRGLQEGETVAVAAD